MPNLFQNPFFQAILLFLASSVTWYFLTDKNKTFKKKIFELMSDGIYYFFLTALGLNVLFNFKEILSNPYRAILFSSMIAWLASILVISFLMIKKRQQIATDQLFVSHLINYFLILGLFNHLFYYYKYQNLFSVLFIVIYFVFYLLKNQLHIPWKNEILLATLGILHGLLLFLSGNVILYYQIVYYPYQITSLFLLISLLLFYFRSDGLSKRK